MNRTEALRGHAAMGLFSALVAGSFSLGVRAANLIDPAAITVARFVIAAGVLAGAAWAQADYPSKAVRIIAPFPAGSGPDANAREIAAELTKLLGQSFYVENRPGASNIIGTEVAAKAPADGYSLYIGTTPLGFRKQNLLGGVEVARAGEVHATRLSRRRSSTRCATRDRYTVSA